MDYLIDTDIIIDFLKNQNNSVAFFTKIADYPIKISVINQIEIEYGIQKSVHPQKRKKEFQDFLDSFSIIILPVDSIVAKEFIKIKIDLENKKTPLADFDLLIAASAIANNLKLATRNTGHFQRINSLQLFK